jgi:DNA-binding response OmpR family regulator
MSRILIVEDDALIALDMQLILEDAGLEVIGPVGTSQDALTQISARRPDAALLDGRLQGETSDAIAAALAEQGVPFAFVTGRSAAELPPVFRSAPLLMKPYTASELVAMTRRLLSHAASVPC